MGGETGGIDWKEQNNCMIKEKSRINFINASNSLAEQTVIYVYKLSS